jgi:hypothetical protein
VWGYGNATCLPERQRIELATDREMTQIEAQANLNAGLRRWQTPELRNCATYYWRVTPIANRQAGQPSSIFSFFVQTSRTC